jgi:hypothetical protein
MHTRPKSADPRPKNVSLKIQHPKKSSKRCGLEEDIIPPVAEQDHYTGDCYCYLCTCGQHPCPGEHKRKLFSTRSHFSTSYQQDFKRYTSQVTALKPFPEFQPAKYEFDAITTSKSAFSKPDLTFNGSRSSEKLSYKPVKFVAKSSYSSNYSSFYAGFLEKQYNMDTPYVKSEARFTANSNYRDQFQDFSSKRSFENSDLFRQAKEKAKGTKGIISLSSEFIGNSSQKVEFQKNKCKKPAVAIGYPSVVSTCDYRAAFTSTYKDSFTNPIFEKAIKKKYSKAN